MKVGTVVSLVCVNLAYFCTANSAVAQEAAESAALDAGVAMPQARATRSLAGAISESLRATSDSLSEQVNAGRARPAAAAGSGGGKSYYASYAIPANVDTLAGTHAPTYRILGSGAVIRVSLRLIRSSAATCIAYCR